MKLFVQIIFIFILLIQQIVGMPKLLGDLPQVGPKQDLNELPLNIEVANGLVEDVSELVTGLTGVVPVGEIPNVAAIMDLPMDVDE